MGVYGATGAVGRATVARLAADGVRLRLGGRNAARLASIPCDAAERVLVPDVHSPEALQAFCAGTRLVVNCAGPSSEIGDTVLRAALDAGADYVDAGGESLATGAGHAPTVSTAGRRVVLGAGFSPGLTGLVPRHLAAGERRVRRIRGWCGGLDRFTDAAAADMVASLGGEYGTALAAVRAGAVAAHALEPESGVHLPGFPDPLTAYPFLPVEAVRLARDLGVPELDWYTAFAGPLVLAALTRRGTAAELIDAARADLAGRDPYQVLVVELEYADGAGRTLVLRGTDGYRLTAAVLAAAATAVLNQDVPPGTHLAAEVLDPADVLDRLRGHATLSIVDGPVLVEEGAL